MLGRRLGERLVDGDPSDEVPGDLSWECEEGPAPILASDMGTSKAGKSAVGSGWPPIIQGPGHQLQAMKSVSISVIVSARGPKVRNIQRKNDDRD